MQGAQGHSRKESDDFKLSFGDDTSANFEVDGVNILMDPALELSLSFQQPKPSHNPLGSSVWANTGGSLSASWGPAPNSGNIWGTAPSKPPQQPYNEDDDDDDEDSDDGSNGDSFWDDAVKAASKIRQQKQPPMQQRQQQPPSQSHPSKMADKRTNRDEETLRRLFQHQSSADEFSQWCEQALRGLSNASVAHSTFLASLSNRTVFK